MEASFLEAINIKKFYYVNFNFEPGERVTVRRVRDKTELLVYLSVRIFILEIQLKLYPKMIPIRLLFLRGMIL